MSSSSMDLSVFVRLKDRFSGKLRGIMRGLNRLGSAAKRIGAVAGIIAGITFAGPAAEAAKFDQSLRDMGVTSGIELKKLDAWIAGMRDGFEELALLSGQYSSDVAKTAAELKAMGLSDSVIADLMPSISDTATAASAEISDISKVVFALNDTLGITAAEMPDALGMLVVAGKEGRFELREMAKYFPQLTAQVVALGVKGKEAVKMLGAGLQIAIKGASLPSEAANNYKNFLQKILAPDTIKRFKDQNVDILAVMKDAAVKGINPIEAVIAKTQDLTGVSADAIKKMIATAKAGGLEGAAALELVHEQLERIGAAGKLAELFGDQQVKAFLLPILANIDEYKRIGSAMEAANRTEISSDKDKQMAGPLRQRLIFTELGIQSARDFGDAFNSWLPTVNKHLLELRSYMQGLESDVPGAKNEILSFAAAGLIAAMGLGILGFVLPAVATGIGVVGSLFAAAFSPIGLTIALLAAGAILIMKNWDKVGPFFDGVVSELQASWEVLKSFGSGFGEGFMDELGPALKPLTELAGPIGNVAENILSMSKSLWSLFSVEVSDEAARGLGEILGQFAGNSLGTAAAGLKLLVDTINYLVEGLQQLFNFFSGKPIEWDVLAGTGEEVFSSIGDLLNRMIKTLGDLIDMDLQIDWSALGATLDGAIQGVKDSINDLIGWFAGISWPSLPSWFGGGGKKPPTDPESYGPAGAWQGADASNTRKSAIGPTGVSPISQRSNVQVGGQITIKVDGPGKVTSTQSANSKVPINAGRTVGSP